MSFLSSEGFKCRLRWLLMIEFAPRAQLRLSLSAGCCLGRLTWPAVGWIPLLCSQGSVHIWLQPVRRHADCCAVLWGRDYVFTCPGPGTVLRTVSQLVSERVHGSTVFTSIYTHWYLVGILSHQERVWTRYPWVPSGLKIL